jgi:hypothetical protein
MIATNLTSTNLPSLSASPVSAICANGSGGGGGGGGGGGWSYNYMPYSALTTGNITNNTAWPSINKTPIEELVDRVSAIEERLCIIHPIIEHNKKFAALKRAYDQYKLIEKLCIEPNQEP